MIYIARHGQTDWNLERRIQGQKDVPLNDTGRKEAIACAEHLSSIKMDEIISSDLSRAMETANIINKFLSVSINSDSRLKEINCGDLEGNVVNEVPWNTFIHNPKALNSEPLIDFYNRLKEFFDEINSNKNTVIVTHTGVVKMIKHLSEHPDSYNSDDFEKTSLRFKVKNGDIFTWDKSKNLQLLTKNLNSLEY